MPHRRSTRWAAPVSSAAFAGGLIPLQNWYAPSLTSNKEAGLGDWDIEDIVDLLKTGVSQRGAVFGPMAEVVHNSLQYLTDADIGAMAVYLKSMPQKNGSAGTAAARDVAEVRQPNCCSTGKKVYTSNCAKCHAANGLGKPPAYPPLANNQSIQMHSAVNPIRMVLNGGYPPSTDGNPMPLRHAAVRAGAVGYEVAAVVTYIRMSWGNHGTPVSPQQVSNLRSAPLD